MQCVHHHQIHKEMDAVRVKIRQLDKALEAAYNTSENPHQTEEVRHE